MTNTRDSSFHSAMTAHCDARVHSELDANLVQIVMGSLGARSATVARLRKLPDGSRSWFVSAYMRMGDPAVFTPMSSSSFQLAKQVLPGFGQMIWPMLSKPGWNEALFSVEPVSGRAVEGHKGFNALTVFEVVSDISGPCILEIESAGELLPQDRRMVSLLLRSYRQMEALRPSENRDAVTGLLNAKAFDQLFQDAEVKAASLRSQEPSLRILGDDADLACEGSISFVMGGDIDRRTSRPTPTSWLGIIGIDDFSHINAAHGHLVGDDVLLIFARIVRSTFRHHDRFYRFGGDEIGVVLRCATKQDAFSAFDRFRSQLRRYDFPLTGKVSASVGYTRIKDGDNAQAVIARAQMAISEAKEAGSDAIVYLDDDVVRDIEV